MAADRRPALILACALGLVLALAAYAHQWRHSELPDSFPVAALAYPVRTPAGLAGDPSQLRYLAESFPPGTALVFTAADGTACAVTTDLREGQTALVVTGISGLLFLWAAVAFFAPRALQPGVGGLFGVTFLYGLAIMVGGVFLPREVISWVAALGLVQIACLAALPAVFLALALGFPRCACSRARRPAIAAAWLLAAASFATQAAAYLRYAAAPTPARADIFAIARTAGDLVLVTVTAVGVVVFALRARRLETLRERRQVRWLLWGFAIGAAPYVFLRTLPILMGFPAMAPPWADRVVELAIPLSFAGAVVWERFLDIDVIIRRSLLYGLLAAIMVLVYLAGGLAFTLRFGAPQGVEPWLPPALLGLVAGAAFLPVRRLLGSLIDRTFFKVAHDHERRLEILERDLAPLGEAAAIASCVRRSVEAALLPAACAVFVRGYSGSTGDDGSGRRIAPPFDDDDTAWPVSPLLAPGTTSVPELETTAFPSALADAGWVIVQPLDGRRRTVGAVAVGRRATGRHWVEQDLAFLAACGRLAGSHAERVALQRSLVAETLARERLAEIDRMKTEFLSQVAHDLRTPAAGIAWSARNLLDGLAGEPTEAQVAYLQAIAGAGAHLNRLVDNLLEISRLDRAAITVSCEPFAFPTAWRDAATMVAADAAAKRVTVTVVAGDVPPARGDVHRVVEAALNILDNAVKYTAAGSEVTVTFAVEGDQVAAAVRDHGPGLRGQSPAVLFARFAQGVPSPHSARKGFGLGLHIAATLLELMGGSLDAADHPDGGAVFTSRLKRADRGGAGPEGPGT